MESSDVFKLLNLNSVTGLSVDDESSTIPGASRLNAP